MVSTFRFRTFKRFCPFLLVVIGLTACADQKGLQGSYKCISDQVGTQESANALILDLGKLVTGKKSTYETLQFEGSETVTVRAMGVDFASTYERDGEYIRIRTDKSDLLFKVLNENTLLGEGFAAGIYRKMQPGDEKLCIAYGKLTVRQGEALTSPAMGTISPGNTFSVIEKVGGGYKIESGGKVGYIDSDEFVSVNPNFRKEKPTQKKPIVKPKPGPRHL